jgi:hypothetical protein
MIHVIPKRRAATDDQAMSRQRVERQVIAEHRRLDGLFAAVRAGFVAKSEAPELSARLRELRDALEVHFRQEDELYYPILCALRPDLRVRLEACVAVHARFRELLSDLALRSAQGQLAGSIRVFETLAEDFRRHEVREEELLSELGGELREAR